MLITSVSETFFSIYISIVSQFKYIGHSLRNNMCIGQNQLPICNISISVARIRLCAFEYYRSSIRQIVGQ